MNAFLQAVGRRRIVDVLVANLAYGAVAFSFGAIGTASGLPPWVPILFSAAVFAGGSQFAALSIVMSGGSLVAATATALAINARMLAFGVAIADVFAGRLRALILGAHLIVDVTAAMALDEPDPVRRRAVFWFSGIVTYVVWVAATIAGALTGKAVGSLDRFGLDTALPLVLLAPIAPALRRANLRRAAVAGAALALAGAPFLPPGYPILVGLCGFAPAPAADAEGALMLLAILLSIAAGTYALRLAGPLLHRRGKLPAGAQAFLADAAVVLLLALAAISAITQNGGFAGWGRVLGVLVGAALIVVRMPLALVLLISVATTAALRWCGIA